MPFEEQEPQSLYGADFPRTASPDALPADKTKPYVLARTSLMPVSQSGEHEPHFYTTLFDSSGALTIRPNIYIPPRSLRTSTDAGGHFLHYLISPGPDTLSEHVWSIRDALLATKCSPDTLAIALLNGIRDFASLSHWAPAHTPMVRPVLESVPEHSRLLAQGITNQIHQGFTRLMDELKVHCSDEVTKNFELSTQLSLPNDSDEVKNLLATFAEMLHTRSLLDQLRVHSHLKKIQDAGATSDDQEEAVLSSAREQRVEAQEAWNAARLAFLKGGGSIGSEVPKDGDAINRLIYLRMAREK